MKTPLRAPRGRHLAIAKSAYPMTSAQALSTLSSHIASELNEPLPAAVQAFAAEIAAHGGAHVAAVLFYGSNLRSGALDGVLDFYVLVDSLRGWHRRRLPAAANRILPPNILLFERDHGEQTLRAKVAVLRVDQFHKAMHRRSLDTTMWARYAQPAALAWVRDEIARAATVQSITRAVVSAADWAARLGPASGSANDFWDALFRRTYGAELRVEKASRARMLTSFASERYAALLPLAWRAAGVHASTEADGRLRPLLSARSRQRAKSEWRRRQLLGKPLNLARLVKTAYTFKGGVDYVIWKIERHSGYKLGLKPWQRRHPVLAAPSVLWQLRRHGAIR